MGQELADGGSETPADAAGPRVCSRSHREEPRRDQTGITSCACLLPASAGKPQPYKGLVNSLKVPFQRGQMLAPSDRKFELQFASAFTLLSIKGMCMKH